MEDWTSDDRYIFQAYPPLTSRAPLAAQPPNTGHRQTETHDSQGLDGPDPERPLHRAEETIDTFVKNFGHTPYGNHGNQRIGPGLGNASALLVNNYHTHGHLGLGLPPPPSASSFSHGPGNAPSLIYPTTIPTNPSEAPGDPGQAEHYLLHFPPAQDPKTGAEALDFNPGTPDASVPNIDDAGLASHGLDHHGTFSGYNSQEAQWQTHDSQQRCPVDHGGSAETSLQPGIANTPVPSGQPTSYPGPGFPQEGHLNPAASSQSAYADGDGVNSGLYQASHSVPPTSGSFVEKINGDAYDLLFGVGGAGNLRGFPDESTQPDHTEEGHDDQQLSFLPTWEEAQGENENTQTHYQSILPEVSAPSRDGSATAFERTPEAVPAPPLSAAGWPGARADPDLQPQAPLTPQREVKRGDRASQYAPNQSAAVGTDPPSGHLLAGSGGGLAPAKPKGKRKGKLAEGKGKSAQKKKNDKTVCIPCRYSKSTCELTSRQSCVDCEKKGLLCTTANPRHLFLGHSNLPPFIPGTGSDDLQGSALDNDVEIAALVEKFDELYHPAHDIRVTSADGNLDVVLNMEGVRERLRRLPPTSPSVSFSEPVDGDRIFKCLEWSACVRGRKSHIDALAGLYRVRSLVTFEYARKDSHSTGVLRNPGHIRALGELFCLLRRNLEIETWEVVHKWLYEHQDKGRKGKPGPSPSVPTFAFHLMTLLFALKEHFQCLPRGPTKWCVGELCKRLYCYYFFLKGKPPNLNEHDVRSLSESLQVGTAEMPSDKPSWGAFYAWVGASHDDVLWWEHYNPEGERPF